VRLRIDEVVRVAKGTSFVEFVEKVKDAGVLRGVSA
jgi:hypothetical protein